MSEIRRSDVSCASVRLRNSSQSHFSLGNMDQDSFRQLLASSSKPSRSTTLGVASGSRPKLAIPPKKKVSEAPSQPVFKPRKVKKPQDSKYRDRASERRDGQGNDYAHVEAVLEDFEKKHAHEEKETIEAQRKYLGGDSEHSVLVKGLDFSLLEQQKAKAGAFSKDDVDALEEAFLESSSHHPEPNLPTKKRTREDLLRELKEKRGKEGGQPPQLTEDDVKAKGKFKPIGFKPIGSSSGKKKKEAADGQPKKKKRKLGEGKDEAPPSTPDTPQLPVPTPSAASEEPIADDFDIFAGAGDYTGVDIDDDDDDDENVGDGAGAGKPTVGTKNEEQEPSSSSGLKPWMFTDDEPNSHLPTRPVIPSILKAPPNSSSAVPYDEADEMEDGEERPMRLVGLASSAVPSIKDLLAVDDAASKFEQKKKRKEKKKKNTGKVGDDDDD